jgi:dCTP deaminase
MSVLCDRDIQNAFEMDWIRITPFEYDRVQPASYDVALGHQFRVFKHTDHTFIDPRDIKEDLTELVERIEGAFVLHPGEFVLGQTLEHVRIGDEFVARLEGKSSLGRIGLVIHSTAGWIDPGFEGTVTMEISSNSRLPILLRPGMLIGQLAFMSLSSPCEKPYGSPGLGSKFQGQFEPTIKGA